MQHVPKELFPRRYFKRVAPNNELHYEMITTNLAVRSPIVIIQSCRDHELKERSLSLTP